MPDTLSPPLPVDPLAHHRPDVSGRLHAQIVPALPPAIPTADPPEPTDSARRRVGAAGALDLLL